MAEGRVTQVGVLAEIESTDIRATQAGALAELIDKRQFVTQFGVLAEMVPPSTEPVANIGNVQVIFNGTDITAHLDTVILSADVSAPLTTNLTSTVPTKQTGITRWLAELSGLWTKTLDDIIGPEVVTPPADSAKKDCAIIIGEWNGRVRYFWDGNAFVKRSRTEANVDDVLRWQGELALSGPPERTVD